MCDERTSGDDEVLRSTSTPGMPCEICDERTLGDGEVLLGTPTPGMLVQEYKITL